MTRWDNFDSYTWTLVISKTHQKLYYFFLYMIHLLANRTDVFFLSKWLDPVNIFTLNPYVFSYSIWSLQKCKIFCCDFPKYHKLYKCTFLMWSFRMWLMLLVWPHSTQMNLRFPVCNYRCYWKLKTSCHAYRRRLLVLHHDKPSHVE